MPTALITGPTSGIGRQFAIAYAERRHDLVLVARDEARLTALAAELEAAHGIRAETLRADLGVRADLDRVAERARDVDVLVNNAGIGLRKSFTGSTLEEEEHAFDVLCRAVLVLCHAAGRGMRERRHGTIINVSSVASYLATGSYSAAKAYVTVLSESLHGQLKPHGVTVTALCPGFVRTEFHARAGLNMSRIPKFAWLDAKRLVDDCLADVERGKPVSVPGLQYKAAVRALKLAPRAIARSGRLSARHRPGARET
jgi:short-subunit dehydrogenase